MTKTISSLGMVETITIDPEILCDCCGGYIPRTKDWDYFDETNGGYCNGNIRPDGICGGFEKLV